jgi:hypothetical protein
MTMHRAIPIILLAVSLQAAGCGGSLNTLIGDAASDTPFDPVSDPVIDDAGDGHDGEPPPPAGWARAFHVGDETWPNAAAPAADGGMVAAGETLSDTTDGMDIMMLRLDAAGNVVSSALYGGRADEHVTDMSATLDGNFIIVGAAIDSALDTTDMMALKIDPDGDIIWQFTYGSASSEWTHDVEASSDGGYVLVGEAASPAGTSIDMIVVRIDAGGNITWQKIIHTPEFGWAISVDETADGHHVVVGETYTSDGNATALWVVKIDGSGNMLFQKSYGGETWNDAGKVMATADGGALVAGYTQEFGAGRYDVWILKLDADGEVQWQKAYGGPDDELAYGVDLMDGGGYVVAGPTRSFGAGSLDMLAFGLDGNGSVLWRKTYGGPHDDYATSVVTAPGGGFLLAGPTDSFGPPEKNAWILRTEASGSLPASCPAGLGQDAALVETVTNAAASPTSAEPRPGTMTLRVMSLVKQSFDPNVETQCRR